ncbi:MAG: helix-turn-helix domain-containing protein [Planctomycetes bacterium]|nr:helix-turn-helix domain-containing protein [Planctomycetota bacterium]
MGTVESDACLPKLLCGSEAALWLRVSPSTLRRWVRQGVVACVVLPVGLRRRRTVRYRLTDLERLVEKHLHQRPAIRTSEVDAERPA